MRLVRGFTLIELLIVIAIVAVLALIAVPNFIESQTRAKIARAGANMRCVQNALEAYCVDYSRYPPPKNDQGWFFARARLTTPVAYLSDQGAAIDPFGTPLIENIESGDFVYQKLPAFIRYYAFDIRGNNTGANDGLVSFYVLASNGPDRTRYPHVGARISQSDNDEADFRDILNQIYDPTNGTSSVGEILRFGSSAPLSAQRIAHIAMSKW
jgi:prepilin-type N-terminal cleavage/methylation domain-containing protein